MLTIETRRHANRTAGTLRLLLLGALLAIAADGVRASETNIAPLCAITSDPYMGASVAYLTDGTLASPSDGTLMLAAPLAPRIGASSLQYTLAFPGRFAVKRVRLFQGSSPDRREASEYLIEADTRGNGTYDRVLATETHGRAGQWLSYAVSPPVMAYAVRFRTIDAPADVGANFGPPALEEFEILTDDVVLPGPRPQLSGAPPLVRDPTRSLEPLASEAMPTVSHDDTAFRRGLFGSMWLYWAPGQDYSETSNEARMALLRRLGVNRYWLYPGVYVPLVPKPSYVTLPTDPDYLYFVNRQLSATRRSATPQMRMLPFASQVVPGYRSNVLGRFAAQMHANGIRVIANELLLPYGLQSWDFPRVPDAAIYPSVLSSRFVRDASTTLYSEFMQSGVDGLALGGDEFFLRETGDVDEDRPAVCKDARGTTKAICKPTTIEDFRNRFGRDIDPFRVPFSAAAAKWTVFAYEQLAALFAHYSAMMTSIDRNAIVTSMFRPGEENRPHWGIAYDVMGSQGSVDEMSSDPYWSQNSYLGHYYFANEVKKLTAASRLRAASLTLQTTPAFDTNGYRDPLMVYGPAFSALMHGAKGINFYKQDYLFAGGANDAGPWVEKFFGLTTFLDAQGLAQYRIPKAVAVLYSRASEDWWQLGHADEPDRASQAMVYQNGVMEILFRNGMPFDLYYLDQPASLNSLGDYAVAILPYPYSLSKSAFDAVRAAMARGTRIMTLYRAGEVDEFGTAYPAPLLRGVAGVDELSGDLAHPRYDDLSDQLVRRLRSALGARAPLVFDAAGRDVECSVMEKGSDRLLFCLNWERTAADVNLGVNVEAGRYAASLITMYGRSAALVGGRSNLSASDLAQFRLSLAGGEAQVVMVTSLPPALSQ